VRYEHHQPQRHQRQRQSSPTNERHSKFSLFHFYDGTFFFCRVRSAEDTTNNGTGSPRVRVMYITSMIQALASAMCRSLSLAIGDSY
jgi:hypothetical protein